MEQQPYSNANSLVFQSFYKDLWRKMVPPGLTEAETDFIEEISRLAPGHHVLDLMCGFGRHAFALANRGYAVTAVDNLPDYVDEIRELALKQALPVEAILGDAASVSFPGRYHAAICMGNSFASFDMERSGRLLHNLAACLHPGATLIINSWMIAEIAIRHFEEKTWVYVDNYKYLLDNRFLLNPSRIETDHIIIAENGQTQVLKGVDYILSFGELNTLLENAGFYLQDIYTTPRKRKFAFGDKRAYIVAVRR